VIAREQDALLAQLEAEVIAAVTGRMHRFERPAVALDDLAIGDADIGYECQVGAGFDRGAALVAALTVRTEAERARAGTLAEQSRSGRMIHVRVRDDLVSDALAGKGRDQRVHVLDDRGARIDDRDLATTDHVRARAVIGERTWVSRHDAANQRRDRARDAIFDGLFVTELDRHARVSSS
jgi:hypothetical protein